MKRLATALLLLFLATSLAWAGDRRPVKPSQKDKCPVCGMFVAKYPDFAAQILFKDGSAVHFDGVKDMFRYYLDMKRYNPARKAADIDSVYVTDYYSLSLTDGQSAFYVTGSDVMGPMGKELIALKERAMADIRGDRMSMIFQEPMTSLNPVFTVGDQVAEALVVHKDMTKEKALDRTAELFDLVGLPEPRRQLSNYPHQLSGGMRQRVMIAMAISCEPSLIIADEPTTALDVTIQAQILELLNDIRKKFDTAIILITHDLGIIAQMADRVAVMYAGRILEYAKTDDIFYDPLHPYTEGLLASIPKPGEKLRRLKAIPGMVPKMTELPAGCKFLPRCQYAKPEYAESEPELKEIKPGHLVRCFKAQGK